MKKVIYLEHLRSMKEVEDYLKEFEKSVSLGNQFQLIHRSVMIISVFLFMIFNFNIAVVPILLGVSISLLGLKFLYNKKINNYEINIEKKANSILATLGFRFNIKKQKWENLKNPHILFEINNLNYYEIELLATSEHDYSINEKIVA